MRKSANGIALWPGTRVVSREYSLENVLENTLCQIYSREFTPNLLCFSTLSIIFFQVTKNNSEDKFCLLCIMKGNLKTFTRYLFILHTLCSFYTNVIKYLKGFYI